MSKEFEQIVKAIRHKAFKPVYLLHGEESYYTDQVSDLIEATALTEAEKSFNQTIVYGKDVDHLTLLDTLKRYPMMAERQVVILKEAQQMKGLEKLEEYVKNPAPSTVFVISYKHKKIDKRKTFYKALKKHAEVLESSKIRDYQLPAWIEKRVAAKGYEIKPEATQLLADYLGNDLSKIDNELEKLTLNVPLGTMLSEKEIEKNIGISKEYNIFEFQNALGARDMTKAFKIVKYFVANPKANPFVMTLGVLYAYFSRVYMLYYFRGYDDKELARVVGVNPYFVRDYKAASKIYSKEEVEHVIHLLHQYDLKSKGVSNSSVKEGELLKEMTYQILN